MNEHFKKGFTKSAGPLLIEESSQTGYGAQADWASTKEMRGERQAILSAIVAGKKIPNKEDLIDFAGYHKTIGP